MGAVVDLDCPGRRGELSALNALPLVEKKGRLEPSPPYHVIRHEKSRLEGLKRPQTARSSLSFLSILQYRPAPRSAYHPIPTPSRFRQSRFEQRPCAAVTKALRTTDCLLSIYINPPLCFHLICSRIGHSGGSTGSVGRAQCGQSSLQRHSSSAAGKV